MSENEQYYPGTSLRVVAPQHWRDRPHMFLGPDRGRWWHVIAERFLGEVGSPNRQWASAEFHANKNRLLWADDSDTPLSPLGLFWRDGCETLSVRLENGALHVEMLLDSRIPANPAVDDVLHLVRRCIARTTSDRTVCIKVAGTEVTIAGDWREYLSRGDVVHSFWSGVSGDFRFEAAAVDSHVEASRAVEVLEQGVAIGTWPELVRLYERFSQVNVRVVLHSEVAHMPDDREASAMAALRQALAVPRSAPLSHSR